MNKQRLSLDAAIDRGVICGTLTASSGKRRELRSWLECDTGLGAMLAPGSRSNISSAREDRTAVPQLGQEPGATAVRASRAR